MNPVTTHAGFAWKIVFIFLACPLGFFSLPYPARFWSCTSFNLCKGSLINSQAANSSGCKCIRPVQKMAVSLPCDIWLHLRCCQRLIPANMEKHMHYMIYMYYLPVNRLKLLAGALEKGFGFMMFKSPKRDRGERLKGKFMGWFHWLDLLFKLPAQARALPCQSAPFIKAWRKLSTALTVLLEAIHSWKGGLKLLHHLTTSECGHDTPAQPWGSRSWHRMQQFLFVTLKMFFSFLQNKCSPLSTRRKSLMCLT